MAEHMLVLLKSIVATPQEAVGSLCMMSAEEEHTVLVEWNDTEIVFPSDKCVHELFEEQVDRSPDAISVVFEEQQDWQEQQIIKKEQDEIM